MPLKIWFGDKEVTNRALLEGGIFNRGVRNVSKQVGAWWERDGGKIDGGVTLKETMVCEWVGKRFYDVKYVPIKSLINTRKKLHLHIHKKWTKRLFLTAPWLPILIDLFDFLPTLYSLVRNTFAPIFRDICPGIEINYKVAKLGWNW